MKASNRMSLPYRVRRAVTPGIRCATPGGRPAMIMHSSHHNMLCLLPNTHPEKRCKKPQKVSPFLQKLAPFCPFSEKKCPFLPPLRHYEIHNPLHRNNKTRIPLAIMPFSANPPSAIPLPVVPADPAWRGPRVGGMELNAALAFWRSCGIISVDVTSAKAFAGNVRDMSVESGRRWS